MAKCIPQKLKTKQDLQISIRSLTGSDAILFGNLQETIAKESSFTFQKTGRITPKEKMEELWEKSLSSKTALSLGAFDQDLLIGYLDFALVKEHPWMNHVGHFGIMLVQTYAGQGLGRKMMEMMLDHAKQLGVLRIEATVRTDNARAIGLYKSMGFEIEGTRKKITCQGSVYYDEYYIARLEPELAL